MAAASKYEADAFAAALLGKTGYSAKGLATMLNRRNFGRDIEGGWSDTHPAPRSHS
jgi:predicted Zn-dependent protease